MSAHSLNDGHASQEYSGPRGVGDRVFPSKMLYLRRHPVFLPRALVVRSSPKFSTLIDVIYEPFTASLYAENPGVYLVNDVSSPTRPFALGAEFAKRLR
jgi:hypothetical protein